METMVTLPEQEKLYYMIGHDLGIINDQYIKNLWKVREAKQVLVKNNYKSVAEFNRDFEMTDEYLMLKEYKYTINALEKMMASVRVRIESLKAETKGQY